MKIIALFFSFFVAISHIAGQTTATTAEICADPAYTPKRIAGDAEITCSWEVELTMPKSYLFNKDKRIEKTAGSPDSLLKAELLAIKKAAKTPENLAQTLRKMQKKHSRVVFIQMPEKPIKLEAKYIFGKYSVKKLGASNTNEYYGDKWLIDSMALSSTPDENFQFTLDSIYNYACPYTCPHATYYLRFRYKLNYRALDLPKFSFYLDKHPDFAKTFMESDVEELIASKLPFVHIHSDKALSAPTYQPVTFGYCENPYKKTDKYKVTNALLSEICINCLVRDIYLDKWAYWGLIKQKNNAKKAKKDLIKQAFKLNKK